MIISQIVGSTITFRYCRSFGRMEHARKKKKKGKKTIRKTDGSIRDTMQCSSWNDATLW